MVYSVTATALSGLAAAGRRLENVANNIVNQQSAVSVDNGNFTNKPFQPQEAVQKTLNEGGVQVSLQPVTPAFVPVFQPENMIADKNGIVNYPNINQEKQIADGINARYDFKANLRSLKTEEQTSRALLDIIS